MQTAEQSAALAVYLVASFDEERGKVTTRARISTKTLRRISGRVHLREAFVAEWVDELGQLGWSAFPSGDAFALIRSETVDDWPRIASKRISTVLERVDNADSDVFPEVLEAIEPYASTSRTND